MYRNDLTCPNCGNHGLYENCEDKKPKAPTWRCPNKENCSDPKYPGRTWGSYDKSQFAHQCTLPSAAPSPAAAATTAPMTKPAGTATPADYMQLVESAYIRATDVYKNKPSSNIGQDIITLGNQLSVAMVKQVDTLMNPIL